MDDQMNAVWKPITVGELQFRLDEQNKLIDLLRGQIKDQHDKLRDRFAMAALPALIAILSDAQIDGECHYAYLYADAMMKARKP